MNIKLKTQQTLQKKKYFCSGRLRKETMGEHYRKKIISRGLNVNFVVEIVENRFLKIILSSIIYILKINTI